MLKHRICSNISWESSQLLSQISNFEVTQHDFLMTKSWRRWEIKTNKCTLIDWTLQARIRAFQTTSNPSTSKNQLPKKHLQTITLHAVTHFPVSSYLLFLLSLFRDHSHLSTIQHGELHADTNFVKSLLFKRALFWKDECEAGSPNALAHYFLSGNTVLISFVAWC